MLVGVVEVVLGGGLLGLLADLGLVRDDLGLGRRLLVEERLDRLLGDQVDRVGSQLVAERLVLTLRGRLLADAIVRDLVD